MELTLTRAEFMGLFRNLNTVNIGGRKVAYAVVKNITKLQSMMKNIADVDDKDEKYKEYVDRRNELVKKLADRDENGELVAVGDIPGNYSVRENEDVWKEEIAALDEEFKDCLDNRDAFFNEEETMELHAIKEEHLPEEFDLNELRKVALLLE